MRNTYLLLLIFLPFFLKAQLQINQPAANAVFQRNNAGTATIAISGTFSNTLTTKVEARLLNPSTNQPITNFDWTTIQSGANYGNYIGKLYNVPGGWYVLQVRILYNTTVLETASLTNIGVGEVFVMAGQSNAQGYQDYGSISATDSRVKTYNYNNSTNTTVPNYPTFSDMVYNTNLSLIGRSSWAYGKLGDLLTSSLNVPVVFFNAARGGTTVDNWKMGSDNQLTYFFFNGQPVGPVGFPYVNMTNILKFYGAQYGVRGVLWHQGESDNEINTSTSDYQSKLTYVINKSRSDFDSNLSWMISRVSYNNGTTDNAIIGGQNSTIQNVGNTFYGPETDNIQPRKNPDPEGSDVHFEGSTLVDLGNAWNNYLNSSFFANSTPIQSIDLPAITITCNSSTNVHTLSAPAGYAEYKWIRIDNNGNWNYDQTAEATTQSIQRNTGVYMCYLKSGNKYVTSQVIDVSKISSFCQSQSNCNESIYLSNLPITSSSNGYGSVKIDKNNDNGTIILNGISFNKGFGTYANSEIVINVNNTLYDRLQGVVGIDDNVTASCGDVVFRIYGDNNLLFTSPTMTPSTANQSFDISVVGYSTIKLTTDMLAAEYCDNGDWADMKLTLLNSSLSAPTITSNVNPPNVLSGTPITLTATGCSSPNYIKWSDNVTTTNPYTIYPTSNVTYTAKCLTTEGCESGNSNSIAITTYNCESDISLVSPPHDYGSSDVITMKASNTITAQNQISGQANVTYSAGKSVTLNPGFIANNGTVFTAKIGGCDN